jgi:hypothetical protein
MGAVPCAAHQRGLSGYVQTTNTKWASLLSDCHWLAKLIRQSPQKLLLRLAEEPSIQVYRWHYASYGPAAC